MVSYSAGVLVLGVGLLVWWFGDLFWVILNVQVKWVLWLFFWVWVECRLGDLGKTGRDGPVLVRMDWVIMGGVAVWV